MDVNKYDNFWFTSYVKIISVLVSLNIINLKEDILPFCLRGPTISPHKENASFFFIFLDYHSTHGPLPVSGANSEISHLHETLLEGARELKYKPIDCNGRDGIGMIKHM